MNSFLRAIGFQGNGFKERGLREGREFLREDVLRAKRGGGGLISAPRMGINSVTAVSQDAFENNAVMWRSLRSREPVDYLPTDETDGKKRFEFAQDYYDRDASYIAGVQDTKYKGFLLMVAITAGILAIDIATWRSYTANLFLVLGHIAPLVPAVIQAVIAAFHNWQIRFRRLDGFLNFARRPAEWIPEPSSFSPTSGVGRSPAAMVLLAAAGVSTLIMGTAPAAHAQADTTGTATVTQMFTSLSTSDLWNRLLGFVFPQIGPINTGTITPIATGIADGFSILISVLMAFAAALMAHDLVVAAVSTAHEGEVLGKKIHSTWAPIRVVYGFAALAPVVKGYCLLQILVLWIAVASGWLGNDIWAGFLTGITAPTSSSATASVTAPNIPESIPFVKNVLLQEVCFAAYQQTQVDGGGSSPAWPTMNDQGVGLANEATGALQWIGSIFFDNNAVAQANAVHTVVWNFGPCGTTTGTFALGAGNGGLAAWSQTKETATNTLVSALQPIAGAIVASQTPGVNGGSEANLSSQFAKVLTIKGNYDTTLQGAGTALASNPANNNSNAAFASVATSAGWASAGAYYMTLARINAQASSFYRDMPTSDISAFDKDDTEGPLNIALWGNGEGDTHGLIDTFDAWWAAGITAIQPGTSVTGTSMTGVAAAGTPYISGAYGGLKEMGSSDSWLQQHLMNIVQLDPGQFNGLQEMVNTGDYIIGVSETLGAGALLAPAIAKLTPVGRAAEIGKSVLSRFSGDKGGVLTNALSAVGLFMFCIIWTILAAGVYDSLILPMIPFIHFTFATMGILIIVLEGVAAAPIWAFSHIKLNSQEEGMTTQASKAGYTILFNLIFRIPLTLFGLFFSIQVFNAMVWLLSMTVYPAMAAATTDSLFGVVGTVAYIVLITILNYQVANRSFNLITQIPDRITRWFGANDHGGSEHGEVNAAVAAISSGSKQSLHSAEKTAQGVQAAGKGRARGDERQQQSSSNLDRTNQATAGTEDKGKPRPSGGTQDIE
jgi:conjugal transfer/type IV secretion protein DotA/TraY